MSNQVYRPLYIFFFVFLFISTSLYSNDFYAYYTKLPSNFDLLEDYQEKLFSKYSDFVIQIGEKGKVVFSRNTSYLPVWQTGDSEYVSNLISGKSYKVEGHEVLWKKGVIGTALQFDGYYSGISVPGQQKFDNPELLTLEGWFALTAYPFDWAPLIHQSEWNKKGFYLGIDKNGFPGFHVSNSDKWISLVDSRYLFSPRNDGWGTFSDEYWTIYPDGVAVRHLARGKVFDDGCVEMLREDVVKFIA